MVLSSGLWGRRFGNDPLIIGKTISISGDPHVVVGVVGSQFNVKEFGPAPDVWIPFQLDPESKDQGHYFRAAARVKPGVSVTQAAARLQLSADEFRTKFPNSLGPKGGFTVTTFQEAFVKNGMEAYPAAEQTPEAATALLKAEIKRWGDVIRTAKIEVQQ